jgi:protein-tyrosine kinase
VGTLGKIIRMVKKNTVSESEDARTEIPIQSHHIYDGKEKAGWVSPVYSQSRRVVLDTATVVENRCIGILPDAPELEFYKVLRTHILQRTRETGGNTIMVTSAYAGEGKTLTAINLALTFAKEYKQTALLVDCDLRQQTIHRYLGTGGEKGLIDYLLNDVPVSELIVWPQIEKLTMISGGKPFYESSELLGSPKMKELIAEMKSRYPDRYVFFDVPPILVSADALAFAPLVDRILVVVQSGRTNVKEINRALELLPREKILGLVLNGQRERIDGYKGYHNSSGA